MNAVSAPGGYVFVTRGLLQRVDNEAALAGVLSHEIAHVTRKDAFLIYVKTKVDQCKTLAYAKAGQKEGMGALRNYGPGFIKTAIYALDSFSGGPLDLNAAANTALLTLFSDEFVHRYLESGYARDQELSADAMGLELTVATGYNPRGSSTSWGPARRADLLRPPPSGAGPGGGDEVSPGQEGRHAVLALRPGHLAAPPRPAARRAGRGEVKLAALSRHAQRGVRHLAGPLGRCSTRCQTSRHPTSRRPRCGRRGAGHAPSPGATPSICGRVRSR